MVAAFPFLQELHRHHHHGLAIVANGFAPAPPQHEPPRARHRDIQSGREVFVAHRRGRHYRSF
jgi:hypothetical protein